MRARRWIPVFAMLAAVGCTVRVDTPEHPADNSQRLPPERRSFVEAGVRHFAADVARDVSKEGPAAWRKEFEDSPSFFMASEGKLAFPNGQAAGQAIDELAGTIKQIELQWGGDLRVDALADDLAVVASSYHEMRVDKEGHRVEESGFFTGLAEQRNGRWQFRNAHWSVREPLPAPH